MPALFGMAIWVVTGALILAYSSPLGDSILRVGGWLFYACTGGLLMAWTASLIYEALGALLRQLLRFGGTRCNLCKKPQGDGEVGYGYGDDDGGEGRAALSVVPAAHAGDQSEPDGRLGAAVG